MQQHVEKGNDDGLYISSVACCQDLWALIMDAGTGFAQQVYDLSNQVRPPCLLCLCSCLVVRSMPWAGKAGLLQHTCSKASRGIQP